MVRSEDASKVNRVVERFKLAQTDNITIRNEIEKDKMEEMMKEAKEKAFLLFLMRKNLLMIY